MRLALLLMLLGCCCCLCLTASAQQEEDIPHSEVGNWALKFGVDLWAFGRQLTRMHDIKQKYRTQKPEVKKKDGLVLVREMAAEVKNMMDFKINAVMKLMEYAEEASKAAASPSSTSQPPKYYASKHINLFSDDGKLQPGSREMYLTGNRHFDHIAVNLSLSAVLMPPGVKDTDADVASGLQWSEYLDPLFVNNYESDPSLSWQYFGSTSGFLRRFPAISWPPVDTSPVQNGPTRVREVDDFRLSDWFVGAATSVKDLAILMDGSALSYSKTKGLAIATVNAILDSLTQNDYVNVYKYAENAEEIVKCFKDSLVLASPENVKELKNAMSSLKGDSSSNISAALSTAFEILNRYNRSSLGSQCNQAIMLVTSRTDSAPEELIKRYNFPHMPVRIFTYVVGGDSSQELNDMSCTNKGYYARIINKEEINSKVVEYIKVLARPMVLYQRDHPIHFSPVYVGGKSSRYGLEGQGQLMTSVTAPILDHRNHTVRTANLLGIVGLDVPIEQIQKLVPPYKLGVNGYSFLVDNNGRVLWHPDLRPLPGNTEYEETLKRKYLSVDLSEVELTEYDGPSHSNNSLLLDMRKEMIDQKEGETYFSVKTHYDDMKRVSIRRHNYYYKKIEDTPFSLGLALPEGYGMYELHAEQEIRHTHTNVTQWFQGNHWKVHPDWTYCEYYFESDKWFATPEERVLHFLTLAHGQGWKWRSMRPKSAKSANKPEKDSYYCDKRLLQSLVLDAYATEGFGNPSQTPQKEGDQGKGRFDVVRSFIATRSGLLRWHDHQPYDDSMEAPDFADTYRRSMNSAWYKRAVDQHAIEPESFVYSVPFDPVDRPLVTATHAIFFEEKGHKAPVAVVGIQFNHASLASHFVNVTSTCSGNNCKKNCASEDLDCYILDNNGFVIISEKNKHTGKFFGEIDGTIMDSLVQDKIFKQVSAVNYQGICSPQSSQISAAPNSAVYSIMKTIAAIGHYMFTWTINLNLADALEPVYAWAADDDDEEFPEGDNYQPGMIDDVTIENDNGPPPMVQQATPPPSTSHSTTTNIPTHKLRTCEKKTDLYILQPERLNTQPLKGKLTNCHSSGCERPFSLQKIAHTNLILLVVDTVCPCGNKKLGIRPFEARTEAGACTARRERLYRRKHPSKCISYHPEEMEIKVCGGASRIINSQFGLLLVGFLVAHLT
ncbi:voltage-dependent calcium channel subunit alpha-2/delta-3 isoform X2 [Phymastichus coffea]|uniref:voltage-dependent calcium channel subunit alpha-2/delta-3 isoform X2 n=1 Tax=Phymastichus coffea TaxID=108790 RepID=UPI00273C9D8F|nr:voltage-dependent calcium channel subunit alpha-2/delta-3 isoform X2 [Phymastichus coffea]